MPSPDSVALKGVTLTYGRKVHALDGIDLAIEPGEFVAIVGPSGCGKSTLLRLVAGFARPTGGEVRVGGEPVAGPGPDRGMVFQQPRLFPWLSVRRNVAFGIRRHPGRDARVAELLDLVGLADAARLRPYELSGGMQQRAAIARALAPDPGILLMDEPFAALDALTRERLQEELRRIWQQTGKTVLFVTHSVDEAVFLGTRVLVMSKRPGRIVLDLPHQPDLRETVSTAVRQAAV
ncbi:ABC transporter ATP-binding protein [Nonomuraea soli]|uniref:ABC-type nitrate/sulfonate/bicarbonate transport system ATPase subunit n=1 Tax=Nonomuraea soli TaxID=1032476 RepID=A0A7W0CI05_9ACTN|nr:ABC transporter ATP-binding protein [Nonomuraea soli]MBA2891347.1 ABC-type nitrate/sulfonate/bicarbonate transport system ATPase subunit [Nonomuraea soli]